MAEEKKPKIDLKARLGKKDAGGGSAVATPAPGLPGPGRASVPPPAIGSGRGSIPPPAISPGIPVPPFAQPRVQRAPAPTMDPNDPFAAAKGVIAAPKAQEIRVEVGTEALEAAKANRKWIGVAAVVALAIGIGMGWNFGVGSANAKRERDAIEGAGKLAVDVDAANLKIKELATKIQEAGKALKAKKFPETFSSELGALNIPFDADKLFGRGVGSYDAKTLDMLFQFTSDVQAINSRKDALKSLFGGQKKAIIETLEAAEKPQLRYTLLVIKAPKGPVGSIAPIQDPFALGGDWPKDYKMQNLESREVQSVIRYTGEPADPASSREKRYGIPIEPTSLNLAFPNDISGRVLSELSKTGQVLSGVQAAGPDEEERPGLIRNGELLAEALKKIAAKMK